MDLASGTPGNRSQNLVHIIQQDFWDSDDLISQKNLISEKLICRVPIVMRAYGFPQRILVGARYVAPADLPARVVVDFADHNSLRRQRRRVAGLETRKVGRRRMGRISRRIGSGKISPDNRREDVWAQHGPLRPRHFQRHEIYHQR